MTVVHVTTKNVIVVVENLDFLNVLKENKDFKDAV